MSRLAALAGAVAIMAVLSVSGCGEEGGSGPAIVHVYADAPSCDGARDALGRGGAVEDIRVRLSCLRPAVGGGRVDLARVGFDARGAAEDSAAVAYISRPGPTARFSGPILGAAAIPHLVTTDPARAMREVLAALESTDDAAAVRESLDSRLG